MTSLSWFAWLDTACPGMWRMCMPTFRCRNYCIYRAALALSFEPQSDKDTRKRQLSMIRHVYSYHVFWLTPRREQRDRQPADFSFRSHILELVWFLRHGAVITKSHQQKEEIKSVLKMLTKKKEERQIVCVCVCVCVCWCLKERVNLERKDKDWTGKSACEREQDEEWVRDREEEEEEEEEGRERRRRGDRYICLPIKLSMLLIWVFRSVK